jgi:hypothetical protein
MVWHYIMRKDGEELTLESMVGTGAPIDGPPSDLFKHRVD